MYKAAELIRFPPVIKKKYLFAAVSLIWLATITLSNTLDWLLAEAPRLLFTLCLGYALLYLFLWCLDRTFFKFATTQANNTLLKLNDAIKSQTPIAVKVLREEFFQKTWIGPKMRTAVDSNGKSYSVIYGGPVKKEFTARLYILEEKFFTSRQSFAIVPHLEN